GEARRAAMDLQASGHHEALYGHDVAAPEAARARGAEAGLVEERPVHAAHEAAAGSAGGETEVRRRRDRHALEVLLDAARPDDLRALRAPLRLRRAERVSAEPDRR